MTHVIFTADAHRSLANRTIAALRGVFSRLDRARRHRMTVSRLHRLSDHQLRDIGLARDEIDAAVEGRLDRQH
ncbi:MAG TPA: DUF1127 domain-containing protein [Thermohalobaculum sp.]|nr:DUF1127 domain-containing protein [Thermohalobaculum sp.]